MMSLIKNSFVFRFSVRNRKQFSQLKSIYFLEPNCLFHTNNCFFQKNTNKNSKEQTGKNALMKSVFENIEEKKKDAFLEVIRTYENEKHRRGHLVFIKLALKYMKMFGVHKDLESYKRILDIFPKGPYIPRNYFQALIKYYPQHQDTAVELLEQMEMNGVIPDRELEQMLLNIFGKQGLPLKKCARMVYWMYKFSNLNPWPVPRPVPKDPKVLARLAIQKISSVDILSVISEVETKDIEDAEEHVENTWIISAISINQKDLLVRHSRLNKNKPIYVEGPFKVWVADQSVDYFVLRGNPEQTIEEKEEDIFDITNIPLPFWKTKKIILKPTVHQQEDGIYFAVCATGTSNKDSAASWIRYLQKENPVLKEIPILIKLASSVETKYINYQYLEEDSQKNNGTIK